LTDVITGANCDEAPWGGGTSNSVALRSSSYDAVAGAIDDASAISAALCGTAAMASDRRFGTGFESP
jgi:hypothetical protein